MIRLVVVDDQAVVRAGFRVVFESEGDLVVVGEASGGREAVAVVERERPDVVVMDVRMPGGDGLEATRTIAAREGAPPVLVMTTFDLDEHVFGALEAGASGFVLKDADPAEVVDAVRALAAGRGAIDAATTRRVIAEFARRRAAPAPPEHDLTPRELEVVRLLGEGLSNEEVAGRLVVEVATVKSHLTRVMTKLGTRDRLQTVVWAYRSGLLP
ncbi:response regulator transcription factor [Quadrisphaera sp. INWT6]|uniref:response regulator transcription factor n=1 Tax=Quadrisphaera sp. INWT6 TaxID=2596917 RepID=UPI0018925D83|nr:response regulator transcription factor [Quadrisphaera sp. INWT6]MBF5081189.1 response regulator transcription factor [Quadrisphaera sp. INWT6]